MNAFIEFLSANWQFITAVGLGLIELVLLLVFKRRPQLNYKGLLLSICSWIAQAEKLYKSGSEKMSYVLAMARATLSEAYDEKAVRSIVEYILSLPEKKEGKKNEE